MGSKPMPKTILSRTFAVLITAVGLTGCGGGNPSSTLTQIASPTPQLVAVSYWGTTPLYDQLPSNTIAIINPSSGILNANALTVVSDVSAYATIVAAAVVRKISMLGYVSTGYFSHTCDVLGKCQTWSRIDAQVRAYFQYMPSLAGIFFDEAAPVSWSCSAFLAEYQQLRDIVHAHSPQAKIAFNAAIPDNCVVAAALAGEMLVLFDGDLATYAAQASMIESATTAALTKGVIPWHLVYSVATETDLGKTYTQAKSAKATYFYATDMGGNWQAGQNTWGSLPQYWQQELTMLGYK
jgi:hypothetical protein